MRHLHRFNNRVPLPYGDTIPYNPPRHPAIRIDLVEVHAVYDGPVRKRLRYQGHDYRAPCCVHVTICTHHRQPLFGTVAADGLRLSEAGQMVCQALRAIHADAAGIALDTHIVMPDHVHAILMLGTNPQVDTTASIPDLVRDLKTRVQRSWPAGVRQGRWAPYDTHLWHRSYHDTLIRNDRHLETTRAYILANPGRWIARMDAT